jgi:hypothetical protein
MSIHVSGQLRSRPAYGRPGPEGHKGSTLTPHPGHRKGAKCSTLTR